MEVLKGILEARDRRFQMRQKMAQEEMASLSLTLNIPGYPKSDAVINKFFQTVLEELKIFLKANQIFLKDKMEEMVKDEDGDFYLAPFISHQHSVAEVKILCEKFETEHPVGRLIDVDVCNKAGEGISSGKSKLCMLCGKHPALVCMRENHHSLKDLRANISDAINTYLGKMNSENIIRQLSSLALQAILSEISLSPKPGLVSTLNSGVHKDMDYNTFLRSTSAIAPYFLRLAEKGCNYNEPDFKNILTLVRIEGLQMEIEMFHATQGINTQKGVIFLMGLSTFIAAFVLKSKTEFDISYFREILMQTCSELDLELNHNLQAKTHGEKCSQKYGYNLGGGARAEAQAGFPTVFNFGLKELQKYQIEHFTNKKESDVALKNTLMAIMSANNDSNILFRSNKETLDNLKVLAGKSLDESNQRTKEEIYQQLIHFCLNKNISPGGSADLLAITVFIYLVSNENFFENDLNQLI